MGQSSSLSFCSQLTPDVQSKEYLCAKHCAEKEAAFESPADKMSPGIYQLYLAENAIRTRMDLAAAQKHTFDAIALLEGKSSQSAEAAAAHKDALWLSAVLMLLTVAAPRRGGGAPTTVRATCAIEEGYQFLLSHAEGETAADAESTIVATLLLRDPSVLTVEQRDFCISRVNDEIVQQHAEAARLVEEAPSKPSKTPTPVPTVSETTAPSRLRQVIVMRHGEREDNCDGVEPMCDPNLTEKGLLESKRVAERINGIAVPTLIVTSPFLRCVQTAKELANTWGISESMIVYDNGLVEVHNEKKIKGLDTTNTAPTLKCVLGPSDSNISQPQWGETMPMTEGRFRSSILRLLDTYKSKHETICLVSHGDCVSTAARLGLVPSSNDMDEVVVYKADFNAYVVLDAATVTPGPTPFAILDSYRTAWMGATVESKEEIEKEAQFVEANKIEPNEEVTEEQTIVPKDAADLNAGTAALVEAVADEAPDINGEPGKVAADVGNSNEVMPTTQQENEPTNTQETENTKETVKSADDHIIDNGIGNVENNEQHGKTTEVIAEAPSDSKQDDGAITDDTDAKPSATEGMSAAQVPNASEAAVESKEEHPAAKPTEEADKLAATTGKDDDASEVPAAKPTEE
eukprot:PhM_4_TR18837/c0_g1_i2/m.89739